MDILALGAVGAYSIYKSYRSKNGGKFYSAPETKKHYDNISAEFETYSKLAEALKGEMDGIATTDSYQGQDADGVKQLMSTTEPETLDMILDLHKKIEQYYADVIDAFARDVDSSPEAFLSFDMLDLIKQDFWEMLNDYNTEAKIAKEKIEEYSNKYSGKYNHTITIPDFSPGKDAFIALCGEEDGDGADDYLSKCQKMLVDFDEAMATHLADLNLMDLVDAINQRLIAQIVERYPELKDIKNLNVLENRYKEIRAEELLGNHDAVLSEVDREIIDEVVTKKYNELMDYHRVDDTYEFENMMGKCRDDNYQMTNVEQAAMSRVADEHFDKLEKHTATDTDIDICERLLKGCISVTEGKDPDGNVIPDSYLYTYNENVVTGLLSYLDYDSLAYQSILRICPVGECGEISRAYSMQILSFDIQYDDLGIAIYMDVNTDDEGVVEYHHDKGIGVSRVTATNYINNQQKTNSSFGNGLSDEELAEIYLNVYTQNDKEFMYCLVNDHEYDDAFSRDEKLSEGGKVALLNYTLHFYQTDKQGDYVAGTTDGEELIKILNSCIDGDSQYTNALYEASEMQTAEYAWSISCCSRDSSYWNVAYAEYCRELKATNLFSFLANSSDLWEGDDIKSITQTSDDSLTIKTDNGEIITLYCLDASPDLAKISDNLADRTRLQDEIQANLIKNGKTLLKDGISGVGAFFGPYGLIGASVINLFIDSSDSQIKTSVRTSYTSGLKRAKANKAFAAYADDIEFASNAGSLTINVVMDVSAIVNDYYEGNVLLEEDDLKRKAAWFGGGVHYRIGSGAEVENYYLVNNDIVSPLVFENVQIWEEDGLAAVLNWDDQTVEAVLHQIEIENNEEAYQNALLLLTGENESGDSFSLLSLESYSDFENTMSIIQYGYNDAYEGSDNNINILSEWRNACQP